MSEISSSDNSFIAVWRRHPTAMTMATVVGAAIGITATVLMLKTGMVMMEAGDEPPIRVKNGTLDLELPTGSAKWQQLGDLKHWRIGGKTTNTTQLNVAIYHAPGKNCAATSGTGTSVDVTYSDGTKVTLDRSKKHTEVTSTADLSLSTSGELLSYTGTGHISDVFLNSPMCSFQAKNELLFLSIW